MLSESQVPIRAIMNTHVVAQACLTNKLLHSFEILCPALQSAGFRNLEFKYYYSKVLLRLFKHYSAPYSKHVITTSNLMGGGGSTRFN